MKSQFTDLCRLPNGDTVTIKTYARDLLGLDDREETRMFVATPYSSRHATVDDALRMLDHAIATQTVLWPDRATGTPT